MSLTQDETKLIQRKVEEFVVQEKSFTAFDVTQALKGSVNKSHFLVKEVVHAEFESGAMGEYNRDWVQIPGAPRKAFLYHLPENTVDEYLHGNFGHKKSKKNSVPMATAAASYSVSQGKSIRLSVDGRLYLPRMITRKWKLSSGDNAFCIVTGSKIVVRKKFRDAAQAVQSVRVPVDVKYNLRIPPEITDQAGGGACYLMELVGDEEVTLTKEN